MASESGVNGFSKSPAAALQEKHSERHGYHPPTVQDEEDSDQPKSSAETSKNSLAAPSDPPAKPSQSSTPSVAQSTTKSPGSGPKVAPVLDVRSEESFPALGSGTKTPSSASVASAWGSRKSPIGAVPPNGTANGSHLSSNVSPRASTPSSEAPGSAWGNAGQSTAAFGAPRTITIPGKHVEQIRFAPSQMLPRGQLKKPIRDILRDTSKRYQATVDVRNGPGHLIIFEGKGTVDAVRQALKEVAQQVGSKVCIVFLSPILFLFFLFRAAYADDY